jgi:hypothetical protein
MNLETCAVSAEGGQGAPSMGHTTRALRTLVDYLRKRTQKDIHSMDFAKSYGYVKSPQGPSLRSCSRCLVISAAIH